MFRAARRLRRLVDTVRKNPIVARVEGSLRAMTTAGRLEREGTAAVKAFKLVGAMGDYLEFGAFEGGSFIGAYYAARDVIREVTSDKWDHSFADGEASKAGFRRAWDEMRFIAFDSFEGMPEPRGVDTIVEAFPRGSYACSEEQFRDNVRRAGVPLDKVVTVKGFFERTLTGETAKRIGLTRAAVIHIDSDLYESAKRALDFVTPYLCDGSVVIFNEWYQFHGNPTLGEQRAFADWRAEHPDWLVTEFQKEGAFLNSFILSRPRGR